MPTVCVCVQVVFAMIRSASPANGRADMQIPSPGDSLRKGGTGLFVQLDPGAAGFFFEECFVLFMNVCSCAARVTSGHFALFFVDS